jgi:UDP-glucuronate 4-epimerase
MTVDPEFQLAPELPRRVLVTGAAGFIGSQLCERLLAAGCSVLGVDNFDPYYDPRQKRENLASLLRHPDFRLIEADVACGEARERIAAAAAEGSPFGAVAHLAAKVGVRPSLADAAGYYRTNLEGARQMLELAHERGVGQFVLASSSSVYGINPRMPWSEDDTDLQPISPYAASKAAAEQLARVYSHLRGMRVACLRFFTVFGPRQRPDLAVAKFAALVRAGQPVPVYGDGSSARDYTFVDDIVSGVMAALRWHGSPFEVFNLGNDQSVRLDEMIAAVERAVGQRAIIERLPAQPGDAPQTRANIAKARRLLGYAPQTPFEEGVRRLVAWQLEQERVR